MSAERCLNMESTIIKTLSMRKNYDYPAEWLSESERIDDWIFKHEVQIYEWERNLLVNHREEICRL